MTIDRHRAAKTIEQHQAECGHEGERENYRLDDTGPWGCTVVANCVECCATVAADVEPEQFGEVGRR